MRNGICDPVDGDCDCSDGYIGKDCNQKCPPDRYGDNCGQVCDCIHSLSCHHVTGVCDCEPGYTGDRCDQMCMNTWGKDCANPCTCQNGGTCNHVDGSCACKPGYTGQNCQNRCDSLHYGQDCAFLCPCQVPSRPGNLHLRSWLHERQLLGSLPRWFLWRLHDSLRMSQWS